MTADAPSRLRQLPGTGTSTLIGRRFAGMFYAGQTVWSAMTMSKRAGDFRPLDDVSPSGEPKPPLLSDKLIAKLQMAVTAAQRNRMATPKQEANGEQPPKSKR
jgi:hypothetical protein